MPAQCSGMEIFIKERNIMSEFILASASPRRKEIMALTGLDFSVLVSDADEGSVDRNIPAGLYVQELALLKASSTAKFLLKNKNAVVISADTIVTLDGEILGKPQDEEDALKTLRALSGKTHEVYTGYCVMRISDGKTVCQSVRTEVTFKELSDEKINAYIKTGEPMDKAGAYGIQGKGSMLISGINGDYLNVVGLPLSALSDTLEEEFDTKII